jgi:RimJ/RimL family protein N-acetyltransferase
MIFETERLIIRKLQHDDIEPFHEMQGNINVMRYTESKPHTYIEDVVDLKRVIDFYDKPNNDFWVFAVVRKSDLKFLGSVALIKDDAGHDEIGYRFLEKYWNKGYAYESLIGLLKYSKEIGKKVVIAAVIIVNEASEHIIKKAGFEFVKEYICDDLKLPERLYRLEL